jgi:hypothetical protein
MISFGNIGASATAYLNLGSTHAITTQYGIEYPQYAAIVFSNDQIGFRSGKNNQFTPLNLNQSSLLLNTSIETRVQVNQDLVGTVWVVRYENLDVF